MTTLPWGAELDASDSRPTDGFLTDCRQARARARANAAPTPERRPEAGCREDQIRVFPCWDRSDTTAVAPLSAGPTLLRKAAKSSRPMRLHCGRSSGPAPARRRRGSTTRRAACRGVEPEHVALAHRAIAPPPPPRACMALLRAPCRSAPDMRPVDNATGSPVLQGPGRRQRRAARACVGLWALETSTAVQSSRARSVDAVLISS